MYKIYCLNLGNRFHIRIKAGVAPSYISEMYFPMEQSHITVRSLNNLWIPNQRSNRGVRILLNVSPRLWNSLPISLKSTKSVSSFKHKFKDLFLIG